MWSEDNTIPIVGFIALGMVVIFLGLPVLEYATTDAPFTATITVVDKNGYGEMFMLKSEYHEFLVHGYMWGEFEIGKTYNVSGRTYNQFFKPVYIITSGKEVTV